MPSFSGRSELKLMTCHEDIVTICRTVIQAFDFTVLCGYRGEEEQNKAYPKYSNVKYPDSKHNRIDEFGKPRSHAIDVIPYDPIKRRIVDWDSPEEFALMIGHFKMAAYLYDVQIRWGHDWNNNNILWDETGLVDRPHIELIGGEYDILSNIDSAV